MKTLAIDIGGSDLKMVVLDAEGDAVAAVARTPTPQPATPDAILDALVALAGEQPAFERVSCGFPGVVVGGVTINAPNLDPSWNGTALGPRLESLLSAPARVANDADVQGYGAIEGVGVELTVTLGTGVGSGLFVDGALVPNLELGHAPFRGGKSFEEILGKGALHESGEVAWNRALRDALAAWTRLFNPRRIFLGGGHARLIDRALPAHVVPISNCAGLLGGIALWRHN